jgi:Spy/CpxP family protein refolding chaperone
MQRSKQQALAFLLGAVLVGGVLGFSADRMIGHQRFTSQYGPRSKFYDELGLSQKQRDAIDSLSSEQECAVRALLSPQKTALDSIRGSFRSQIRSVFTADQQVKLEERDKEMKARRQAREAQEPKRKCSVN